MMKQAQKGATLVIALLLLVVVTLVATSSIGGSNISLLIVNSMQSQEMVEAAALRGIEDIVSDVSNFNTPAASSTTYGDYLVNVSAATCIQSTPATGYSAVWALVPEDNYWEVVSTVSDSTSGAATTITQGLSMRQVSGSCP